MNTIKVSTLLCVVVAIMSLTLCDAGCCICGKARRDVAESLSPTLFLNTYRSRLIAIDVGDDECPAEYCRAAQLNMMTNIMRTVSGTRILTESDTEAGSTLVKWAFTFPAVRNDPAAVLYCARSISAIQCVSTNDYAGELRRAYDADIALCHGAVRRPGTVARRRYWGPNRISVEEKWRPVIEQSNRSAELRQASVKALVVAIAEMKKSCAHRAEEVMNAIKELDAFSAEEKKSILGGRN